MVYTVNNNLYHAKLPLQLLPQSCHKGQEVSFAMVEIPPFHQPYELFTHWSSPIRGLDIHLMFISLNAAHNVANRLSKIIAIFQVIIVKGFIEPETEIF